MARPLAPWSVPDLRRRCRELREVILSRDPAAASEVATYWPGGDENPATDKGAWIYAHGNLLGIWRSLHTVDTLGDGQRSAAEEARALAAKDAPEAVPMADGTIRYVYPLPYASLEFLTTLDRAVLRGVELAAQFVASDSDAGERVVAITPLIRLFAVQLWAWVLTAGAGALPFELYGQEEVRPPDWTGTIAPDDLLALYLAHQRVNGRRSALIAMLFPPEKQSKQRLDLAGFIGAYAHEKGLDGALLFQRFSVGKIFAQAVSAAEAYEQAKASAQPAAPTPEPAAA